MPIQPNGVCAYAPSAVIISIIDRARDRGLPTPVTKDVLMRAGVSESLIPRTLQSLQQLDLITEDGVWTQHLETLRRAPEAEFQTRLAEIIRAVYADVFQFVDPSKDSATAIRDAFRSYTPHGQQDRMVSLFMGLCQRAGIVSGDSPAKTIVRELRPNIRKPTLHQIKKPLPPVTLSPSSSGLPPPLAGVLATLPKSGWTKEDRDKFVNAFTAMLDFSIPIRSADQLPADQLQEQDE